MLIILTPGHVKQTIVPVKATPGKLKQKNLVTYAAEHKITIIAFFFFFLQFITYFNTHYLTWSSQIWEIRRAGTCQIQKQLQRA